MRTLLFLISLSFSLVSFAWECPDLMQSDPEDLALYYKQQGHLTGHDEFKRIVVSTIGVLCLYQKDDPNHALILSRFGRFKPLHPDAAYWHYSGAGTTAMYCTESRARCNFH